MKREADLANRYGLEIRAAAASDAAGLAELLGQTGEAITPQAIADRLDRMRDMQGAALLAVEWGPPSGIVVLHWYQGLTGARPSALITTLYVAHEARRRGIGRLLVKAASQAARVAGCDTLGVANAAEGRELAAFCGATGFTQAGALLARSLRKKGDADAS